MTGSWQDSEMGRAYHEEFGGSEEHEAVPELFEAGWKLATQARQVDRDALRSAIQEVLWNTANYPDRAQVYILGADVRPLTEKVTDAVIAHLSAVPVGGEVTHDDMTLVKVYDALMSVTQSGSDASNAVTAMQNAGILFRERAEVTP